MLLITELQVRAHLLLVSASRLPYPTLAVQKEVLRIHPVVAHTCLESLGLL